MGAVDRFSLRVEEHEDGPVVRVSGELDLATAPRLEECLRDLDGQTVTLDFSELTFIASSGLRVLLRRHKRHGAEKLVLREVQRGPMQVFEVTGMSEVLNFDVS
jgi:anti-sigma B factor antagonist